MPLHRGRRTRAWRSRARCTTRWARCPWRRSRPTSASACACSTELARGWRAARRVIGKATFTKATCYSAAAARGLGTRAGSDGRFASSRERALTRPTQGHGRASMISGATNSGSCGLMNCWLLASSRSQLAMYTKRLSHAPRAHVAAARTLRARAERAAARGVDLGGHPHALAARADGQRHASASLLLLGLQQVGVGGLNGELGQHAGLGGVPRLGLLAAGGARGGPSTRTMRIVHSCDAYWRVRGVSGRGGHHGALVVGLDALSERSLKPAQRPPTPCSTHLRGGLQDGGAGVGRHLHERRAAAADGLGQAAAGRRGAGDDDGGVKRGVNHELVGVNVGQGRAVDADGLRAGAAAGAVGDGAAGEGLLLKLPVRVSARNRYHQSLRQLTRRAASPWRAA